MNVALITDSFPPMVDGVSRSVLGYASAFHGGGHGKCIVVTPRIPGVKYHYPFPVYSFLSVGLPYAEYRAGHPLTPKLLTRLKAMNIDIIHAHSPFVSMAVARQLRLFLNVPIVFTQHTKWDYDIARAVPTKTLQKGVEQFVYKNLSAANELWAVSRGAAGYFVERGYSGEYVVMPNGTDFAKGSADSALTEKLSRKHGLPEDVPVLLFVGRMMWYKNIGLIIDALELLHKCGFDFRMVFVGDGEDLRDITQMARDKGLADVTVFAGRVNDREVLRAYFTRSNLFVFPSVYDNAPLVVREAAACACPSLVVRGSSASEMLEDGATGFFAEENAESLSAAIQAVFSDREKLAAVSAAASEEVYLSWSKVAERSADRYKEVIKAYAGKNA
ncbi:MAG: glycosyltransferase [Oscillospiraceae bacterium]|nr:glycosyltransferase [Oscillospiraceae bacterium]